MQERNRSVSECPAGGQLDEKRPLLTLGTAGQILPDAVALNLTSGWVGGLAVLGPNDR
jgi:hypothetical protein